MLKLGYHVLRKSTDFSSTIAKQMTKVGECASLQNSQFIRKISFFNKLTGEALWKGVVSVSNAGKKRGRGRGGDKKGKKNLNKGQRIGEGKANVVWPGLNCPILQSNTLMKIQKLPQKTEVETEEIKKNRKFYSLHPLERGWSGRGMKGRSIGPPDADEDVTYEDFDSIVVENKLGATMTALLGRKRHFTSIVLTGNKNGLIGVGRGRCPDSKSSITQAKNKAIKRLLSFNLQDPDTVNHNFFSQFGATKLFVYKKPKGYGLKCHRVIKACCQLIGIKDLAVNIEGTTNTNSIIYAFLIGLMNQKSYQEIADEKKLHLIEYKYEQLNYPQLLASPKMMNENDEEDLKNQSTEYSEQDNDFEHYIWGNRVLYRRPKPVPFYEKLPSWQIYLKRTLYCRNQTKVKTELYSKYGKLRSFLADIYPECSGNQRQKKTQSE